MKKIITAFVWVFLSASLLAVVTSAIISTALGFDMVPIAEIIKDFILGAVIAAIQLIWIGSEKDNKAYTMRSVIHFAALLPALIVMLYLFGWLPMGVSQFILFLIIFVAIYLVIWIIMYRQNKKLCKQFNKKLDEYKNK
ncbi:MAG: DUF3021 domain-containing protein [Christensenellaceae bacterium]